MASIQFREDNKKNPWRVAIRRKGFPDIIKSFKTENEAILYAAQIEDGIDRSMNNDGFTLPKLPLKIWIDRWEKEQGPLRAYFNKEKKFLRFWAEHLGDQVAIEITPTSIEGKADLVLQQPGRFGLPNSRETRRKYLLYLSSLYSTAMKTWKWATYNPLTGVDKIRRDLDRKRSLITEEIPSLNEFKTQFCSLVKDKMKSEGLSQRSAAKKCNMTLHAFQFSTSEKENMTIKNIFKICNGFGINLVIHENH